MKRTKVQRRNRKLARKKRRQGFVWKHSQFVDPFEEKYGKQPRTQEPPDAQ